MKNKFLVMAVVFSMASLLILPSVFAAGTGTPEVEGEVTSGSLTLTAVGDYAGTTSAVVLDSVSAADLTDTVTTSYTSDITGTARDRFYVLDESFGDPGYRMMMEMTSSAAQTGNFDYAGTAASATAEDIPFKNFSICADNETAATYGKSAATAANVTGSYTQTLVLGSSSNAASASSLYGFDGSFTEAANDYCKTMVATPTQIEYAYSDASGITKSVYQLRKLRLEVPGGRSTGTYKSTLLVTLLDGNP